MNEIKSIYLNKDDEQVTKEEYEREMILHNLLTQDNQMTSYPMFCVIGVVEIGEKDHEGKKHIYQKIEMMREVFFTQREADDYIKECAHEHDGKLFVYVKSGYKNAGWKFARDLIINTLNKE